MSIHVAITRRVRSGCEAEFEKALREFLQASFGQESVLGASMLTPLPGSNSREFGILRTFPGERERDAFYHSELFKDWNERARHLTEGEAIHRPLTGLEAFFRSSSQNPPPRWKMASATFLGVLPVSMLLNLVLGPVMSQWPFLVKSAAFNVCMVTLLTWIVMPVLTRLLHRWLHPSQTHDKP